MGRNPEVQSSYLSPECKTYSKVPQEWPSRREFFSKAAAASYLEGMGHPAVELEHVIVTGMIQCLSRKDHFLKVDDYLDYRLSETPELRKIVDPTFVKVTPLPKDIYRHSSVLVEEKDGKFQLKDVNSVPLSLNGN
ncbi:unnamed protein product [Lepeophtheirus salmonis]|nr:unnamed protein product [Lepeophtheirus salmonis]CAF2841984.1 unnamed protein product [Lepeophtheirus salmonis]